MLGFNQGTKKTACFKEENEDQMVANDTGVKEPERKGHFTAVSPSAPEVTYSRYLSMKN